MEDNKVHSKRRQNNSKSRAVDMNFTVSGLRFASQKDKYRLISTTTPKGLVLKLERLRSPNQWQLTVSDIATHGPSGIPQEVVFSIFKTTLESLTAPVVAENDDAKALPASDAAKLDLETGLKGVVTMFLDIPLAGVPLTYVFEFIPLAREPMDVLESSLRDAHDDIQKLQAAMMTRQQVIALRSSNPCDSRQTMQWNTLVHNGAVDVFSVSEDHRTITVAQEGVFLINVRITAPERSSDRTESLMINNVAVATSHMGCNSGCGKSATINDVFVLKTGDKVTVQRGLCSTTTCGGAVANSLSIIRL